MKLILLFSLFLVLVLLDRVKCINNTVDELPLKLEENSEQELSLELEETNNIEEGWSDWSEWSPCSRSCDGGISHKIRSCDSIGKCRGNHIRYRICNMQPCPESHDFRLDQCSAYNTIPLNGIFYEWVPYYSENSEPCALICKGKPVDTEEERLKREFRIKRNLDQNKSIENSRQLSSNKDNEFRVKRELSSRSNFIPNKQVKLKETTDVEEKRVKRKSNTRNFISEEEDDEEDEILMKNYDLNLGTMSSDTREKNNVNGGGNNDENLEKNNDETDGNGDDDDMVMVVETLANRVGDGTRCRWGSLDMCIEGKCRRVGCDLKIDSNQQVDACGVCGGDGTSCLRPLYHWSFTYTSLCSATCGGGYKMSRPICQNRLTGQEVEEKLCNESQRPDETVVECNVHNCPPKWFASEWGQCSVSCGGGIKLRQVQCVEETNNTKILVDDLKCGGNKPWYQEGCNQFDCPSWIASKWSGCSVSCGEGIQIRKVECKDSKDRISNLCLEEIKPSLTKRCATGIQCPFNLDTSEELLPGLYNTQPLIQPLPPMPEKLIGEQIVPSESTFIPDDWGPCSTTCGPGVRHREVHCKIFLEFSRTIAKLPDKQCTGPKPLETESCYLQPCSAPSLSSDQNQRIFISSDDPYSSPNNNNNIKVAPGSPGKSYSWREQGFTHCSATCLGGIQELIVNCVRDDTEKVTSPYMCPIELKPEIRIQTCNDHPCPPRWNYSEFSECSQSCGIGIQTREVNCIHEVTQGGGNTVTVPHNMCPQPAPPDRQYCNVLDCPVRWQMSAWSKCSKSCGGGVKTRTAECKQIMAQNHTVNRIPVLCPVPKPSTSKVCNTKSCIVESDKPVIELSNSTFIQHDSKKRKITLKIGGAATVFFGTTIKIKCPVKRFDRTKIQWFKDNNTVPKNRKFKISKKGAIRISNLTLRDSGTYTCTAGKSRASINLSVRPKPGEFLNSEEIQKQQQAFSKFSKNDKERGGGTGENFGSTEGRDNKNAGGGGGIFISDDHSHEQSKDRNKKKLGSRLFTPTLPSLRLDTSYKDDVVGGKSGGGKDRVPSLPSSTSEFSSNPSLPENSASSSSNRLMPNFQRLISNLQFLWPLQAFSNSRGHRMIDFPDLYKNHNSLQEVPIGSASGYQELEENDTKIPSREEEDVDTIIEENEDEDDDDEDEDNIVVLGKGKKENLEFEWKTGRWSKCSESCGGNGVQQRKIGCIVKLYNASQPVDDILCEDAGLFPPPTKRKCGFDDCPKWFSHEWSSCEKSKCFDFHRALQRRIVRCEIAGNLTLDPAKCDENQKPIDRQECVNEKCVGKWKVGRWSECTAACELKGLKYRIIQCVWHGTKKPAGTACKDIPRPPIMKPCVGKSCTKIEPICMDHSMFCRNVKIMKMCKILRYKQQCCQTCNYPD